MLKADFCAQEGAVTGSRLRIAGLMALVALAALNLGVMRALLEFRTHEVQSWLLGALPMANVLAVSVLIGLLWPGSRPFLGGFVAFGAVALSFYIAVESSCDHEAVYPWLAPVVRTLEETIGRDRPVIFSPVLYAAC